MFEGLCLLSHSAFSASWIPTNRDNIARNIITHTAVDQGDPPVGLDSLLLIVERIEAIVDGGSVEVE